MPENWYAIRLFDALSTQWRATAAGSRLVLMGLRYEAIPLVHASLRRTCPHARPLHEVVPLLQHLETEAMQAFNA